MSTSRTCVSYTPQQRRWRRRCLNRGPGLSGTVDGTTINCNNTYTNGFPDDISWGVWGHTSYVLDGSLSRERSRAVWTRTKEGAVGSSGKHTKKGGSSFQKARRLQAGSCTYGTYQGFFSTTGRLAGYVDSKTIFSKQIARNRDPAGEHTVMFQFDFTHRALCFLAFVCFAGESRLPCFCE